MTDDAPSAPDEPKDLRWKVREVENKRRKKLGLQPKPDDPDDDGGQAPILPPNPEPEETRWWDR